MTQIKPDSIQFSSLTEPLLNYDTLTSTISISGSVANLTQANFSTTINIPRSNSIADIYAYNRNTGEKMSLIAGSVHHPYQNVSTEGDAHSVSFSSGVITITLTITNATGGSINLTSQVWDIVAVLYDVPY